MSKRRRLNREKVIVAAVGMANEAGQLEAVTLTALAQQLSIRTPSLYNHVANLDDLHRGMAAYGLQQLTLELKQAVQGMVGQSALQAAAVAYRRFAHTNRGIYPLLLTAPQVNDTVLQVVAADLVQTVQLLFASLGLRGDEALHAVRGFRALLHGFVDLEMQDGFKMPLDIAVSFQRLVTVYLDGLPLVAS